MAGRRYRRRKPWATLAGIITAAVAAAIINGCAPSLVSPGNSSQAPSRAEAPLPTPRYTLDGTVVKVADGDTVTLRTADGQRRIRLDSIDAPEMGHGSRQPGQPYARNAREHLAELVAGQTLTAQCYEQDQYDRDICTLVLPDGRSANRVQVEQGYAWAYTARRGAYLRDAAMPGLQERARRAGAGLWAQPGAVAPWQWRYDCWRQGLCQ